MGEVFKGYGAQEIVGIGLYDRIGQCGLLSPLFTLIGVEAFVECVVFVDQRCAARRPFIDVGRHDTRLQDEIHPLLFAAHINETRLLHIARKGEPAVLDRSHGKRVATVQVNQVNLRSVIGRKNTVDRIGIPATGDRNGRQYEEEQDSFHTFKVSRYSVRSRRRWPQFRCEVSDRLSSCRSCRVCRSWSLPL